MEYAVTARWLLLDPPRNFTLWGIDGVWRAEFLPEPISMASERTFV
jgi:hypothetical protein